MKRAGQKRTGPGTSTVAGRRISFAVSFAELGIPPPTPVTPLLVWAVTKRPGTQDHAPTPESGDRCSRPEFTQEVLTVTTAPPPPPPSPMDLGTYGALLQQFRIDAGWDGDGDGVATLAEITTRVERSTPADQVQATVERVLQSIGDADQNQAWSGLDDTIRFQTYDGLFDGNPNGTLEGDEQLHLQALMDELKLI